MWYMLKEVKTKHEKEKRRKKGAEACNAEFIELRWNKV